MDYATRTGPSTPGTQMGLICETVATTRAIRIETVPVFQKASKKSESAGDFGLIDPLGHQGTLRI